MIKKLLLVLVVIFSVNIYCDDDEGEVSASIPVSAVFLDDITVKVEDMDFGMVVSGVSGYKKESNIVIESTAGEDVEVTLDGKVTIAREEGVILKNNSNDELFVKLNLEGENNLTQNSRGVSNLKVIGKMDVPKNQKSGSYSGNVVIKVNYN